MAKKEKEVKVQRFFFKTIKDILFIVVLIAIGAVVARYFLYNKQEKVSNDIVKATLEEASELTTAKLKYKGYAKYKDSGVAILNRSDFLMVYKATMRAGIDLKKVDTEVDDEKKIIWVTVPKAEIQEVKIDPSSIKYYDEKIALFNTNEKEDAIKAQELAEKEAKKEAKNLGVLELADKQAKSLIKGILEDVSNGYTIKFK